VATKELAPKAKKFRSIEEIMRDPKSKAKLTNAVDEAVKCKGKIAYEQQNIKVLRDTCLEELGLKPAIFNNFVAMTFNNDYQQRKEGLEQQLTLVEIVMTDAGIALTHTPSDDE
jgi:hypothetical protein